MSAIELQTRLAPVKKVQQALSRLNTELYSDVKYRVEEQPEDAERLYRMRGKGLAHSFYTEYDKDYWSWVATIIWIVPDYPEQNEQLLSTWTELCQLGSGRISDNVAFAYCDYVTAAEYVERYEVPEWSSILVDVNDAAER